MSRFRCKSKVCKTTTTWDNIVYTYSVLRCWTATVEWPPPDIVRMHSSDDNNNLTSSFRTNNSCCSLYVLTLIPIDSYPKPNFDFCNILRRVCSSKCILLDFYQVSSRDMIQYISLLSWVAFLDTFHLCQEFSVTGN